MNFKDKLNMFNKNQPNQPNQATQELPTNKNRSITIYMPNPINDKNKPPKKTYTQEISKKTNAQELPKESKEKKVVLKRASALMDKEVKEIDKMKAKPEHNYSICPDKDTWQDIKLDPFSFSNLNEISDYEKFDETKYLSRKYTKDNINNGKQFFKIRFIQNKIGVKEKKGKSFINSILGTKSSNNNDLNISNLDKEKNFRLYNSDFLMILEKAILNFNHKNYKESYDTLCTSKIIRNTKEFGEFLLVVSGFDKYLIGEFLAKQKAPNEKGEVLNSFIESINMNHNENGLLDCIRFLLSRINLPKDANLILVIMETFTSKLFKVNEKNDEFVEIFKNTNNIYLLVSTLLALNTMFTRTDIKNMNTIKKDEFINMNNQVKESYLSELYDQLKKKPITMSDDYNEYIYQKLTPLVAENAIKTDPKNKSQKNDKQNSKKAANIDYFDDRKETSKIASVKINFDNFTKEDEETLCNINKFYKISGAKTPNLYEVIVFENCTKLYWDKNLDLTKLKKANNLNIADINEVYNGLDIAEHSSHIKKYIKANPTEEKLCNTFISISYNNNKETLDLKCDNVEATLLWFKALKSLINKENKKKESQNDEEMKERENIKKEIWENFITKRWDKYGNYLILKVLERSNYYYYLSNDLKQSTKNELLDDKKANTAKYINNFLDSIKSTLSKKDIESNEFYFLCNLGFPDALRKDIWSVIIGNPCCVTKSMHSGILNKIPKSDLNLNFQDLEKKFNKNKDSSFNRNATINQMITDVIIIKNLFIDKILEQKRDEFKFMLSVYTIANAFFSFRKDIPYNKNFIDIIYLFLLVDQKEENAFININNFLFNNNYIKLLIGNEELRKDINNNNVSFFNQLIKNKLPNIEEHFRKMEIIPELYFIPWMDDLYIKTLNTNILLQMFDLYLINGEYVLFQIGLSILKVLEDELMNMTISQILNLLKRLPDKYKKEKFFEVFNSYNGIKAEYVENKRKYELERQKKAFGFS